MSLAILLQEYFEDTEGAIRIRKSKDSRQHNGQKKKTTRKKLVSVCWTFILSKY